MNNFKYNKSQQQYAFSEPSNAVQNLRYFKNPASMQMSMQFQKKGNNFSSGAGENFYFNNGNMNMNMGMNSSMNMNMNMNLNMNNNNQMCGGGVANSGGGIGQYHQQQSQMNNGSGNGNGQMGSMCSMGLSNFGNAGGRQRFAPYFNKRTYAHTLIQPTNHQRYFGYMNQSHDQQPQTTVTASNLVNLTQCDSASTTSSPSDTASYDGQTVTQNPQADLSALNALTPINTSKSSANFDMSLQQTQTPNSSVTLQISNLDTTIEENELKQHLINRLKPITSVLSIYFENLSVAKVKLPSDHHARQVIAYLHRKKIGHKRITVSYTRESSTLDASTLRCQVAGLLKDIPNYKLSMYKFRELFQSRFKTSISVLDLHEMKDICTIGGNKNEEFIQLRTELVNSIESSEMMECFQHSLPYCTTHFVKSHRGWAEQEIDPLPNVQMTISHVRDMMYALLNNHKGAIPIASIVHCIQADLNVSLERNENGVNFEHLIGCVQGVQIQSNKFSIKTLSWSKQGDGSPNKDALLDDMSSNRYSKYGNLPDSFTQVSREIVELVKLSPKATLKFNRFIPAYHNHFGKQCRVAEYGYTKLIDLFEALSSVIQVMGEGENRQITLTHKIQLQRFKTDLLRILRSQSTKSILLSHMPMIFEQVQGRKFNITDYGVCDINDILDALVNTNVVVVNTIPHMMDTMISIPKRKQSMAEVEKTSNFAAEVVELFKHASQFTILFEKFACSYHYHFGYQCRLSDYGFMKLADLMEAITGAVEMEFSNEEDRKIFLSPKTAQRIFSEQIKSIIESFFLSDDAPPNLHEVLVFHKKQYGYQIMPQTLGYDDMLTCIKALPYIEVNILNGYINIQCHHDDQLFRQKCYAACRLLQDADQQTLPLSSFIQMFNNRFNESINEHMVETMKHAVEIQYRNDVKCVTITNMMRFIITLIDVVESRGMVKIQDLTTILKLSIKACFPFGYPNLISFIQAFPDIFVFTPSKNNAFRGEVKINNQCILTKEGFACFLKFTTDGNNNDNNNNCDIGEINFSNKNISPVNSGSNDGNLLLSGCGSDLNGAASLALQASLQSSSGSASTSFGSSNGFMGSHEINTHPIYEKPGTLLAESVNNEPDAAYPLNSTKIAVHSNESFESAGFFELSSNNISNPDDKENSHFFEDNAPKSEMEKHLSSFCYRENNNLYATNNGPIGRSFSGKESNSSRKRSSSGALKADTPPFTPLKGFTYWNNPVWGESNSPALSIKLPELEISDLSLNLNTPDVMNAIGKKSRFPFKFSK